MQKNLATRSTVPYWIGSREVCDNVPPAVCHLTLLLEKPDFRGVVQ